MFFYLYAEDTQFYMTVEKSPESQEKLTSIYEAVNQRMKARKLKLNSCKTEIIHVGTVYYKNLFNEPVSEKVRSLGVVIDSNLTLRNQITAIKKETVLNLMKNFRIVKLLDQHLWLEIVPGLILLSVDFRKSLYDEVPNKDPCSLRMFINSLARVM